MTQKNNTKALMDAIRSGLKAYGKSYEMWAEKEDNKDVVAIEVIWGDWKHDHLFLDWIVKGLNHTLLGDWRVLTMPYCKPEVTEEDGSDCYSAIHKFVVLN